jgi:hypothetical protein
MSYVVGWDNVVGIATRHGLDGPGIESRLVEELPRQSRLTMRSTRPPIQWVTGSFPGVKRQVRGVNHPLPSSAEVKERVELYPYSPLWAFMACSELHLLPFTCVLCSIYNVYLLIAYLASQFK